MATAAFKEDCLSLLPLYQCFPDGISGSESMTHNLVNMLSKAFVSFQPGCYRLPAPSPFKTN